MSYRKHAKQALYTPISCTLYDYLEIACLYHYHVTLALDSNEIVTGTAHDIQTNKDKAEYFLLRNGKRVSDVRLDRIVSLKSDTKGARFDKLFFRSH